MNKNITTRNSLPVEAFIKEAADYPLLTIEQQIEVANRIKQGTSKLSRNYTTAIFVSL